MATSKKKPTRESGEGNLIGRVFKHIGAAAEVIHADVVKLGASAYDVGRRGLLPSFNSAQSRCAYTQYAGGFLLSHIQVET